MSFARCGRSESRYGCGTQSSQWRTRNDANGRASSRTRHHSGRLVSHGVRAGRDPLSQDNERPVHRVWVDEFMLAACQVTNADYARFVQADGGPAPPFERDSNLNHPQQPVVGRLVARSSSLLRVAEQERGQNFSSADRGRVGARRSRRPRGRAISMGRRASAVAARLCGALRSILEDRPRAGRRWRAQRIRPLQHVRQRSRMVQRLVLTGLLRRLSRAQSTRPGERSSAVPLAEGHGDITSRCRAAPRVRAFHRSFNMRITGFEWRATFR